MADRLRFLIEVDDKGAATLTDLSGKIKNLEKDTTASSQKMSSAMGGVWKQMALGQAAYELARRGASFLKNEIFSTVGLYDAQLKAEKQLETVLRSTAGAAGISANEIKGMARELQSVTTYGDEAVITGANLMLTFTKIGKDVFPQAMETALDMSQALGQDMKSSIIQLGKALQDPILGVTALRRVGVNFSEDQEKMIKSLVDSNRLLDAQKLILTELQTEFGGTARAMATLPSGQLKQLTNIWNDFKESIGKGILDTIGPPLKALMDSLKRTFGEGTNQAEAIGHAIGNVILVIGKTIGVLYDLRQVLVEVGIAFGVAFAVNKIMAFTAALRPLAVGLGTIQTYYRVLRLEGAGMFSAAGQAAREFSGGALAGVKSAIKGIPPTIKISLAVIGIELALRQIIKLSEHIKQLNETKAKEMEATVANFQAFKVYRDELEQMGLEYEQLEDAMKDYQTRVDGVGKSAKLVYLSEKEQLEMLLKNKDEYRNLRPYLDQLIQKHPELAKAIGQVKANTDEAAKSTKIFSQDMKGEVEVTKELHQAFLDMPEPPMTQKIHADMQAQQKQNLEDILSLMPQVKSGIEGVDQAQGQSAESAMEVNAQWEIQQRQINSVLGAAKTFISTLEELTGVDISSVTDDLVDMAEGAVTALSQAASGDIAGLISTALSSGWIGQMFKMAERKKQQGIEQDIKNHTTWMDITDEQMEALTDLREKYGDAHAAVSMYLGELIKTGDVTAQNFDKYAGRMHEILADVDRGTLTQAEAIEGIGNAWTELTAKMNELKLPGASKEMIKTIQDLRGRGMEVAEVSEYVNAELQKGAKALETYFAHAAESSERFTHGQQYLSAMFAETVRQKGFMAAIEEYGSQFDQMIAISEEKGYEISETLKSALDIRKLLGDENVKAVYEEMQATQQILESLGNTGLLTFETFSAAMSDVNSQYQRLIENGASEQQALQMSGQELAKLWWYSEQYGYQLDDNTKKLIEKARQEGAINEQMIPVQDRMLSVLESIADVFGAKIPYQMDQMKNKAVEVFGETGEQAKNVSRQLDDAFRNREFAVHASVDAGGPNGGGGTRYTPKIEPDIAAASGFHGWVSGPTWILAGEPNQRERVDIVPMSGASSGSGRGNGVTVQGGMTVEINLPPVSVNTDDPRAYRKGLIQDIRENRDSIQYELRRALGID